MQLNKTDLVTKQQPILQVLTRYMTYKYFFRVTHDLK